VLARKEKTLGPDHLDVAASANDLALLYNCEEKYTEAEPLYKKAIQIREKDLGVQHPDVVRTREIYAVMLHQEGRKANAQKIEMRPVRFQLNNFQTATP
jgi:tetratricopeptide (TPR) repeat protein